MQLLRLSLEGLPADDRAIYLDQLREHWRLDAWTVAGQLVVLLALVPVIARSGLQWWQWGSGVALLLGSWAWAARAPWRLRQVTLDEHNYPRWRRRTLCRELAQSLGWAVLASWLWGTLGDEWHLLILTGLLVFIYTAMFFTTHDTGVATTASVPILLMVGLGLAGYLISESNGIRTLSEAKIDFAHSRNLIIVSLILVLGLGGAEQVGGQLGRAHVVQDLLAFLQALAGMDVARLNFSHGIAADLAARIAAATGSSIRASAARWTACWWPARRSKRAKSRAASPVRSCALRARSGRSGCAR